MVARTVNLERIGDEAELLVKILDILILTQDLLLQGFEAVVGLAS